MVVPEPQQVLNAWPSTGEDGFEVSPAPAESSIWIALAPNVSPGFWPFADANAKVACP